MNALKTILFTGLTILSLDSFSQTKRISGRVVDENSTPLAYVNIFIKGNVRAGASSDQGGNFSFLIEPNTNEIILCATLLGYEPFEQVITDTLFITVTLKPSTTLIKEIVVKGACQKIKGVSSWNRLSPIDIATTGGSAGDLYRSLQTIPGTQVQGESGRLLVRGGDSRETQTYIDDMHVLVPYTTTGENTPVRGRYSPFMFEGINFSTGGYSSEYGDGLSSVLPLFTKDVSDISKLGINPSIVGLAGGGTKSFDKGSVSLNLDYLNLAPYYALFPNRNDLVRPYRNASVATQFRFTPTERTIFKCYVSYDNTSFAEQILKLKESNLYVNSTFRHTTQNDYQIFAGVALSDRSQIINGALHKSDQLRDNISELHLKTKISRRFSDFYGVTIGVESFLRSFHTAYLDSITYYRQTVRPSINSFFAIANLYPLRNFNIDLSARLEYTTPNKRMLLSPRIALGYTIQKVTLTATVGQYTEQAEEKYLLDNPKLESEHCTHYIVGAKYAQKDRIYTAELYYKDYCSLALRTAGKITSGGYGYSKGFDLYFSDLSLFDNIECQLSYSFNLSERKYGDYSEMTIPQYATRHNASLALKYQITPIKSIVGVTCRYTSGRPYNDPSKEGIMNSFTKPYSSLDMSITFLASKKLIIYGSMSNVLGRKNIYGYINDTPVRAAYDSFVYVGAFISLGGKGAYDVSNF